jgi:hypothetical protein
MHQDDNDSLWGDLVTVADPEDTNECIDQADQQLVENRISQNSGPKPLLGGVFNGAINKDPVTENTPLIQTEKSRTNSQDGNDNSSLVGEDHKVGENPPPSPNNSATSDVSDINNDIRDASNSHELFESRNNLNDELDKRKQSLLDLYISCECQRQMHRLALEYYLRRDTWLHFLPLTVLTIVSGTFAFLGTSDFIQADMKEYFSLLVGIFSIVSVSIQSCAKHSKYAARSEMHRHAALGMKKLGDNVNFHQIDPESGIANKKNPNIADVNNPTDEEVGGAPSGGVGKDKRGAGGGGDDVDHLGLSPSITEKIQGFRMVYNQVMESCNSTIPAPVSQAFALVDTRLAISLNNIETQRRFQRDLNLKDVNAKSIICAATYNELYSEFSNAFGWPWRTLNPHDAVNRAIAKVHRTYTKSNNFLSDDYDMDEDIYTLCSRTFCFCMDTTSWFWTCYCCKKHQPVKK